MSWRKAFRHLRTFLSDLMPFTLSHHPMCDKYSRGHYITVGKYDFCIGCTFTYPAFFVVFFIQIFYRFFDFIIFEHFVWIIIAVALFLVLYVLNVFDRNIFLKIFSKVYLGSLIALIILYALYVPQIPLLLRVYLAFFLYVLFTNVFSGLRIRKIMKICRKCSQWNNFPMCDGFRSIIRRLIRDGFALCVKKYKRVEKVFK